MFCELKYLFFLVPYKGTILISEIFIFRHRKWHMRPQENAVFKKSMNVSVLVLVKSL